MDVLHKIRKKVNTVLLNWETVTSVYLVHSDGGDWTYSLPPQRRICNHRCLLATLCKNFQMDLHKIFTDGWQ